MPKQRNTPYIDLTKHQPCEGEVVDITYQHKWHTFLFKNPAIWINGTWYVKLDESYKVQGWRDCHETG